MLYDNMILKGSAVLKSRIQMIGGSHPSPEWLRTQKCEVWGWPLSGLEATADG